MNLNLESSNKVYLSKVKTFYEWPFLQATARKKQCLNKLTYSKSRPGELCVFLPRALEVGFTFSLLILCMILLMSF